MQKQYSNIARTCPGKICFTILLFLLQIYRCVRSYLQFLHAGHLSDLASNTGIFRPVVGRRSSTNVQQASFSCLQHQNIPRPPWWPGVNAVRQYSSIYRNRTAKGLTPYNNHLSKNCIWLSKGMQNDGLLLEIMDHIRNGEQTLYQQRIIQALKELTASITATNPALFPIQWTSRKHVKNKSFLSGCLFFKK